MNQTTTFSRRLRGLFTITDYQPAALAKRLGVGVQTVRQWESGTAVPDVNQFREIASFFGLPYAWFLDGADGQPDAAVMAEKMGLHEDTVEELMELAEDTSGPVLDAVDSAVAAVISAVWAAQED
ncbi:MAG TPA: helix-turn-helix transcriptional regulator [Candidatus Fimenecus excrementavium]|nr:helix-turn-helix transcriptional regulator [Candidatus Fimenecus excrementavium]